MTPRVGTSAKRIVLLLAGEDRLGEVEADLLGVDVEGRDELDVADVVAAERDVHEARHRLARVGVAVVLDPLEERAGAVADSGDGDLDLVRAVSLPGFPSVHAVTLAVARAGPGGHARRRRDALLSCPVLPFRQLPASRRCPGRVSPQLAPRCAVALRGEQPLDPGRGRSPRSPGSARRASARSRRAAVPAQPGSASRAGAGRQLHPAPLEEADAGLRAQVAGEGEPQREASSVLDLRRRAPASSCSNSSSPCVVIS